MADKQLKTYRVGKTQWQYLEGEQPEGAEEVTAKAVKAPANKARTATDKVATADTK